jgi:hypothetical protein
LRETAVSLRSRREAAGVPATTAQYLLAQVHAAYRDLQAVTLGAEPFLDLPPAEDHWPLRRVLQHIIDADRAFLTLIWVGLEQQQAGLPPSYPEMSQMEAVVGSRSAFKQMMRNETLSGIFDYYEGLHLRILADLAALSDDALRSRSRFWEKEPQTAAYRLLRMDAHLRQHTVQAEKTLVAVGWPLTEARRLLRLVYNALADVEGAGIGTGDLGDAERQVVAEVIAGRAEGMVALFR